ncbi:hypothetical protein CTI12_AA515870 [Artemisia annua]|uniref:Uncharacterized protein n=1 Tax=Artemisia annua TaxID=35608 RepID=A0A2U1L9K9_ARTAN|nr:hypothetical protein CTI12_AA515870 [Artemisia annua]
MNNSLENVNPIIHLNGNMNSSSYYVRNSCNFSTENTNVLNDITNFSQCDPSQMRLSQNTSSRSGRGRRRLGDITRANNGSRTTIRSRGAGYSDSAVNLMTSQTYPSSAIGMTRHSSNENFRFIRRNVTLGGTQSSGNIECLTNPSVNNVSSTLMSAFCSSRSINLDNGPDVNLSNVSLICQTTIRRPRRVSRRSTPSTRISNSNGSFVDTDSSDSLDSSFSSYWDCGVADRRCEHCQTVLWYEERTIKSYNPVNPKISVCCGDGKIRLDYIKDPPDILNEFGSCRTSYQSLLNNDNEIEEYLNWRYISACEACYKNMNFDLHYWSFVVERLPFHEEDCNRVYFRDDDDAEVITERSSSSKTKFTEWMVANQLYPEGRHLTYVEYPSMFTWHDDIKAWKPRKNGDDTEWVDTICGGSEWQRGRQLIDLFVSILLFCDVSDVGQFFRSSLPYLAPDVVHSQRCHLQNPNICFTDEEILNYTLLEIDEVLNSNNRSLSDFTELP